MATKHSNLIISLVLSLLFSCLQAGGESLEATCKQGGELTVMYWHHCPYIMPTSRARVSGVFPTFLRSMVQECCHGNTRLVYQQTKGPADFYTAVREMRFNRLVYTFTRTTVYIRLLQVTNVLSATVKPRVRVVQISLEFDRPRSSTLFLV